MKLDLSDESWDDALPPEGAHSAVVAGARVFMSNSGDREFCELTFALVTGHRVPVLLTIWVDEEQHDRTRQPRRSQGAPGTARPGYRHRPAGER